MSLSGKMTFARSKASRELDLGFSRGGVNVMVALAAFLLVSTLYLLGHPVVAVWSTLAGLVWLFVAGAVKATGD